ncbi:MAG: hypothetical protein M3Q64_00785 [bacterium]|nr:hypothetical protein [bacterium]
MSEHEPSKEITIMFKDHFIEDIRTPIILPENYSIIGTDKGTLIYKNKDGEIQTSDPYMHHSEDKIIVDEFRKQFPHDSVIVLLSGPHKELYLQVRGQSMRWEPGKIDLASIVGQRRAVLIDDLYEPMNLNESALATIRKETGLPPEYITQDYLVTLGKHFNQNTNEHQTIFGYQTDTTIDALNVNLKNLEDQGELWLAQNYRATLEEYFGDKVQKYAGGENLRPVNFISDAEIQKNLTKYFEE